MDTLNIIIGIILLVIGTWVTIVQIKVFAKGEQGKQGFDIKLLFAGITALVGGIILISKHL